MTIENRHALAVMLPSHEGELVRDFAQAHHVTYASAVCALIRHGLQVGGPVIMEPFGEKPSRQGEVKKDVN